MTRYHHISHLTMAGAHLAVIGYFLLRDSKITSDLFPSNLNIQFIDANIIILLYLEHNLWSNLEFRAVWWPSKRVASGTRPKGYLNIKNNGRGKNTTIVKIHWTVPGLIRWIIYAIHWFTEYRADLQTKQRWRLELNRLYDFNTLRRIHYVNLLMLTRRQATHP